MDTVADVVLVVVGFLIVCVVLDSAMRTFVLPRAVVSRVTRMVFRALRVVFDSIARRFKTYEGRDRVMALYAPFGLLALVVVWMLMLIVGYALMFQGATVRRLDEGVRAQRLVVVHARLRGPAADRGGLRPHLRRGRRRAWRSSRC